MEIGTVKISDQTGNERVEDYRCTERMILVHVGRGDRRRNRCRGGFFKVDKDNHVLA